MALHRANSKTLGFLPKGAFEENAKLGQIIIGLDGAGVCIGYLLYRVARSRAAIVHLCVSENARGNSVARHLVERLKADTKALEGIGLYCRRDYEVNHVWPKFGFEAVNSKAGRGQDGAELTFWWFSHGHADLFSPISEPDAIRQSVVIDANVFFDLHGRDSVDSEDSKALLADWVQASVELVITKELLNEIQSGADQDRRQANRSAATHHPKLKADDSDFQRVCGEIRPLFPSGATPRDEADLRQVAYAIAGKAPFFATRDETLVERCEALYKTHGLLVLHPAELINHLDSVEREGDYRPARIEGSRLKNALLKADTLDIVVEKFKEPNEREGEFKKVLLRCLSQPKGMEVQVITDHAGSHVLLGVLDRQIPHVISIPVLRQGRHEMAGTMLRNFLRAALAAAATEGRNVVAISEPRFSNSDGETLREFGFIPCCGIWAKLALRVIGNLEVIQGAVNRLALDATFQNATSAATAAIAAAAQAQSTLAMAAIERQLWPAKAITVEVPSFIVSIRPEWAQHFFDTELGSQMLFGLREDLHLGVEGVYYRKARNNNMSAPGRVLWYVSQGSGEGSMTLKACSQLEEVIIGKPKDLYRRFQRLGVYQWQDVYATADHDITHDIVALRFRMTERFKVSVGMKALEELNIRGPFMSPRQISEEQFASIYKMAFPSN